MNKVKLFFAFLFTLILTLSFAAFADGLPPMPETDPLMALLQLVMNIKTMTPLAIGMAAVVIGTQVLKKFAPEFKYKRLAVTGLSVAYGIFLSLSQGLGLLPSLAAILVTGGGAVALYEAFKGIGQATGLAAKK